MVAESISVGQLRQNPTRMLRDVKAGATYTITDHGEPVAEVTGIRPLRWVAAADVDALLKDLGGDERWVAELADERAAEPARDPWEQSE